MTAPGAIRHVILMAAAVVAAVGVARADKVDVRASSRDETGRLSLTWPKQVDFDARSADGRFILRFERPAQGDFAGAMATLRRFLGAPEITDGGRAIAFPLKPGVTALTFADKRRIVVDLFAGIASTQDEPASSSQDPAPREKPAELSVVQVRRGEHPDFSRIVFDWTAPVGYVVEKRDSSLFVTFDEKAALDLSAVQSEPLRYISGVRASLGDITTDVAMAVAGSSRVRDFRQDNMIAIDVYAPTPEPREAGPSVQVAANTMRPVPAPNRFPTKVKAAALPLAPPTAAASGDEPSPGGEETAATAMGELRFDWSEPVAAAVFRRAGAVWIVFDRPSVQDLAALRAAAGEGLGAIEQRAHPRATVLRLETKLDPAPVVRRDGLAWIVAFGAGASPSNTAAIEPALKEEAGGRARVVLPIAEPGAPLALSDPATGDPLVIVPVVPLGYGIVHDYAYPQARLLASTQGIVVRPLVDDLRVRSGREEVALTTPGGFAATPVPDATAALARLGSAGEIHRILDLADWAEGSAAGFTPGRQRLEAAVIAAADDAAREQALMRLASFNLAHGFAAETLGIIAQAALGRPDMEAEAAFRALRGAALLMMGRLNEAAADLDQASLAGDIEAAAWRTALRVARGDKPQDADLATQVALVTGYPRVLRKALLGPLAEAAIDGEAPELSAKLVALLAAEAETAAERAEAQFLQGRRLAANGDTPGALAKWREVEADADADRRDRVRAADARVSLALREQKMTPAEAIAELERLDFIWRGDRLELAVLSRLGDLYLGEGNYPKALRTLRRIATNYPDAPGAADVAGKLTDAFEAVLLGKKAATLSPLQTVALYDEFRELTPLGARGDALIGAVAEKMIELDLLDRAAELLDTQVRYRLAGLERAQTGTQLARLYLLDAKPEAALRALELSRDNAMPKPLVIERSYVEARALARLGRAKDALAPLGTIETAEAAAIRADIFWTMNDWSHAAKSLAQVLDHDGERDKAGSADHAQATAGGTADDALHLAVAMALAGNDAGLARLRATYGAVMAESRWRDVFPLIVANTMPTANLQALARDIGPVDSFREYLARPAGPSM